MNYPQAFIRTKTIINNTIHPRPSPASSAQPPVEEEIGAPQRGQDFAFSLTSLEQSGQ